MNKKNAIITLIIVISLLSACSSTPEPATPTPVPPPTETPAPTATQTPPPTPTPVPIGGGTGQILYMNRVQQKVDIEEGTLTYSVYQLERMNLLTGETEVLITADMLEQELGKDIFQARFAPSPDGSQVVISVATAISADGPEQYENYLADPELSKMIPILDAGADHVNWKWSPDGTMLLGDTLIDNARGILIVNNDGSGLRKVIKSGSLNNPVWAPDGDKIYSIILGQPVVTNLDGSESQPVGLENIDGSLITMSFSPDGEKVAYLTRAGEVFLARSDFSERTKVDIESRFLTCRDMYYPTFLGWSSDGERVIFRDLSCWVSRGVFAPNQRDYLIEAEDGRILGEASAWTYLCGWAPDGQLFTFWEFDTDRSSELRLHEVEGVFSPNDASFKADYPGMSCPFWIQ